MCVCVGGGGGRGGGGTLIFSYVGSGYFLGDQNFDFQYFGGVFRRLCGYFGGGGGHHKIGLFLEVIFMQFRVFSGCQGTEWRIFFVC